MERINKIPQVAKKEAKRNGIDLNEYDFNENWYFWDIIEQNEESGTQTLNLDNVISNLMSQSGSATFTGALTPSRIVDGFVRKGAFITEDETITEDEQAKNIANYLYSKGRIEVLFEGRIDIGDNFVVVSRETFDLDDIEDIIQNPSIKFDIYKIDKKLIQPDVSGKALTTKLTLRRIRSYEALKIENVQNENGIGSNVVYLQMNFEKRPFQTKDGVRYRFNFGKGHNIIYALSILSSGNTPIDYKVGNPKYIQSLGENVFLPIIRTNALDFLTYFTNQYFYFNDNFATKKDWIGQAIINQDITANVSDEGKINVGFLSTNDIRNLPLNSDKTYIIDRAQGLVDLPSGGSAEENVKKMLKTSSQEMLNSEINLFGQLPWTDGATPRQLPREGDIDNPAWQTFKNELLFITDETWNVSSFAGVSEKNFVLGGFNKAIKNDKVIEYVGDHEPYWNSEKRTENKVNILKRNAVWLGQTWNVYPEDIVNSSLNIQQKVISWSPTEIRKYIGLTNVDLDKLFNYLDNKNFVPVRSQTELYNIGILQKLGIQFTLETGYKTMGIASSKFYNGVEPFEEDMIIEVEEVNGVQHILNQLEIYGYFSNDIKIDIFSNTYEDSLTNGDIRAKTSIYDIEFEVPQISLKPSNQKGQLRQLLTRIVVGV